MYFRFTSEIQRVLLDDPETQLRSSSVWLVAGVLIERMGGKREIDSRREDGEGEKTGKGKGEMDGAEGQNKVAKVKE